MLAGIYYYQWLELRASPVLAGQGNEAYQFLQCFVWSCGESLLADLAGVICPTGAAVQVPLPALGHRGGHREGADGAGQQLQYGGVTDQIVRALNSNLNKVPY